MAREGGGGEGLQALRVGVREAGNRRASPGLSFGHHGIERVMNRELFLKSNANCSSHGSITSSSGLRVASLQDDVVGIMHIMNEHLEQS